jgi:5'-nucleotidase
MNHAHTGWLSLLALSLVVLGCGGGPPEPGSEPADGPIRLTILAINDFHGALLDHPVGTSPDGPPRGGAALLASAVQAAQVENPGGVLVVDAGDMVQGPLLCNHFEGAPVADVYAHLGVAAAALGNHEFDYGPLGERSVTGPGDSPFGALNAFLERATFTPLSANLSPTEWPLPAGVRPHTIVERQGVRVGLIGVTTPTTPSMSMADNLTGVRFDPVGPAIAASVAALRGQGADVIVVLGHLDGGCVLAPRDAAPPVCEPDGELVDVLEAGGGELDAVVLGHRHVVVANQVDGVAVVEAGARGTALSRVDLFVDPLTRRVSRSRTRVEAPVPLAGLESDPAVAAILAPYVAQIESLCAEPLAIAVGPLTRGRDESAVGNLVADAMRASREDVDVTVINSGSIRADLPAGELSYCDVYAAFPFDPRMVEYQVSGEELEGFLEFLTSGAHSMPQVSGVRLTVDAGGGLARDLDGDGEKQDWERDRLLTVTDERGLPLDPAGSYRFLSTDYVTQRPGDAEYVFGRIPEARVTATGAGVRDAIVERLRLADGPLGADGGWPLLDPSAPRIVTVGGEASR